MIPTLVTAKVTPDLDGIACMLAYADLLTRTGHQAQAKIFGHLQTESEYFVIHHAIKLTSFPNTAAENWPQVILVDSSSMKSMPSVVKAKNIVEIIDHRDNHEPEKEFSNATIQNELIGAAATLIVERFQQANLLPRPDHAKLLYGAIYHNTSNFTASNTSPRDTAAAKFLEKNFNLSPAIATAMFDYITAKSKSNLAQLLTEDAKFFEVAGQRVCGYQLTLCSFNPSEFQSEITETIKELDTREHCVWSFLGVVDINSKQTFVYATSPKSEAILSQALGLKFTNGWGVLPKVFLRKQILVKLKALHP